MQAGLLTCGHLPFDCTRLLISSTVLLRESWSDRDTKTGRMYFIRAEREGAGSVRGHRRTGRGARTPDGPRAVPPGRRGPCLTTRKSGQAPKLSLNSDDSMKPRSLQSAKHPRETNQEKDGRRLSPREQEPLSPMTEEGMRAMGSASEGPGPREHCGLNYVPPKERLTY